MEEIYTRLHYLENNLSVIDDNAKSDIHDDINNIIKYIDIIENKLKKYNVDNDKMKNFLKKCDRDHEIVNY